MEPIPSTSTGESTRLVRKNKLRISRRPSDSKQESLEPPSEKTREIEVLNNKIKEIESSYLALLKSTDCLRKSKDSLETEKRKLKDSLLNNFETHKDYEQEIGKLEDEIVEFEQEERSSKCLFSLMVNNTLLLRRRNAQEVQRLNNENDRLLHRCERLEKARHFYDILLKEHGINPPVIDEVDTEENLDELQEILHGLTVNQTDTKINDFSNATASQRQENEYRDYTQKIAKMIP